MSEESTVEKEVARYRELYQTKRTGWHLDTANPILVKYLNLIKDAEIKNPRILVPLCGKSNDIPFLLAQGFTVFGIEGVEEAIKELGENHGLDLQFDKSESLYFTVDKRLMIYNGNIFKCPIEKWGGFDAVWDRGAFSVFEPGTSRGNYVEFMKRALLSPEAENPTRRFNYLLEVLNYPSHLYDMPPRACSPEQIHDLYGSWCKIKQVEVSRPSDSFFTRFKVLKDHECNQNVYHFTNLG